MDVFSIIGVITVILTIIIGYLIYWDWTVQRKLDHIPGPPGLPLFGNGFAIDKNLPFKSFLNWAHTYGDVIKIKLPFGTNMIFISGYDNIMDMLVEKGKDFGGRPTGFRDDFMAGRHGMFRAEVTQDVFKVERRLVHQSFKAYGPGLARLEHFANEITDEFVQEFLDTKGEPVDTHPTMLHATFRMITLLLYGKKLDKSHPIYQKMLVMMLELNEALRIDSDGPQLDRLPLLRFFGNKTYKLLVHSKKLMEDVWSWYKDEVMSLSEQELDDQMGKPLARAMIDYSKDSNADIPLCDEEIKATIIQMNFAGTLSSASAMQVQILALIQNPQVTKKMREELNRVVGSRFATLKDKPNLPYCNAVVLENIRVHTGAPAGLPHRVTKDTSVAGYAIPKNSIAYFSLYSISYNKEIWGDPTVFRPERFLDDKGQLLPPDHTLRKHLVAFGAGPRVCPGEMFALLRIFLWTTALVQRFDLEREDPKIRLPDIDPTTYPTRGLVLAPKSFKVKFIPV